MAERIILCACAYCCGWAWSRWFRYFFFLWEGLAGNNVKMQCGSFRGIYVETSAVKDS